QLTVVAVVEDREELAVAGETVGESSTRERVGQVVRREARLALLAIGHDRLAGRLEPLDRVLGRLVLLSLQRVKVDLALVVIGVGLLEPHRTRQRADELSGDGHTCTTPRWGFVEDRRRPADGGLNGRRRRAGG